MIGRGGLAIAVAITCGGGLCGCDHGSAPPPVASGPLPVGVVARVGDQDITAGEVARIARAQHLPPAEARDIAVRDTLLARGASARGLGASDPAARSWEGELARRLLRRTLAEARATKPTEAELAEATARRWLEIDRPEGFRTVHAVVRFAATDDEATKHRARALAEVVHGVALTVAAQAAALPLAEGGPTPGPRIAPSDDPDPLSAAFRKAVAAVPPDGLQVQIEPLPAVTAAGRLLVPGEQYLDPDFARAAAALPTRGALSPVVVSAYGAHVILLLEHTPALVLEGEARVAKVSDDIVEERARAAEKLLLSGLRSRGSVAPDAPVLLGLVAVDP